MARWQFGITTVYHFIFVPLTIGLAPLVALMQTLWVAKRNERWLRLTKFFGKLFLINFALGVVTGIVQEFQFGMNWSNYSRFVGDIFGAPLAMEALAAFFIESTFIGLWIFGWDRLSKKVHLAMIWLVALGVNLSAVFIIGANSFMQHPVGASLNPETGRAELDSIGAVLTNPTLFDALAHVITASFLTAGTFIAGICGYLMVRNVRAKNEEVAREVYRPGTIFGTIVILIAGIGVIITGDLQGKLMFEQQPMKMAAAEAICTTESGEGVPFSIMAFGSNCDDTTHVIQIPGITSFLATGSWDDDSLKSVPELQAEYEQTLGATDAQGNEIDYSPNLMITFWSFRLMIGLAAFSALAAIAALWITRKGRVTDSKVFKWICLIALPAPFLASSFGWIFTEMGRQPWIVAPNFDTGGMGTDLRMLTADGVSGGNVGMGTVLTSLIAFTLIYGVLAVAWFYLMKKYAQAGAPEIEVKKPDSDSEGSEPLTFAY